MDEKALRVKITLDEIKSQESNLKNLEKDIQESCFN